MDYFAIAIAITHWFLPFHIEVENINTIYMYLYSIRSKQTRPLHLRQKGNKKKRQRRWNMISIHDISILSVRTNKSSSAWLELYCEMFFSFFASFLFLVFNFLLVVPKESLLFMLRFLKCLIEHNTAFVYLLARMTWPHTHTHNTHNTLAREPAPYSRYHIMEMGVWGSSKKRY